MPGGNPRARVRRPTEVELAATPAEDPPVLAEVDREAPGDEYDGWHEVTLQSDDGPVDLLVKPQEQWRRAENTALRTADWDTLAGLVMPPEDYDRWVDADPTNGQVMDFMAELGRVSGVSAGNSPASRRSSRSMRRR